MQALWALLLGRVLGRDDVVFGVTVSGRPEELAGVDLGLKVLDGGAAAADQGNEAKMSGMGRVGHAEIRQG